MADLFDSPGKPVPEGSRPLADRLRPRNLSEVIGQTHVLSPEGPLGAMLAAHSLSSLILWGPPGVGKTTIARLLAAETDLAFVQISAIFTGVPDLRKVFESAKIRRQNGQGTLLFVDEIHRFNKAQQDGFLPYMEDGTILLVGATTENPSFELNAAVLSRAQVIVLERLTLTDLERLAQRAEKELGRALPLNGEAREAMIEMADGDGRALLNLIEQVAAWAHEAGADLIDTSTGGIQAGIAIPTGPGYQVQFAAGIKRTAEVPVNAVGQITDPHQANEIVETGQADAVMLGREMMRDPHFALRASTALGYTLPYWPEQYERAQP